VQGIRVPHCMQRRKPKVGGSSRFSEDMSDVQLHCMGVSYCDTTPNKVREEIRCHGTVFRDGRSSSLGVQPTFDVTPQPVAGADQAVADRPVGALVAEADQGQETGVGVGRLAPSASADPIRGHVDHFAANHGFV
jgi:hypothetical protein